MICANCYKSIEEIVRVTCIEAECLWGLIVCVDCYKTKIGDGMQPAVVNARQHAATHAQYMLVRLNDASDNRGQYVGHVRDDKQLDEIIKIDIAQYGPADYLVHDVKTKKHIRVNIKSAPLYSREIQEGKK